jgi:ferredoxin
MRADVPVLVSQDGALVPAGTRPFAVAQRFQVAVLADLCNECGDCVTACPTAGRPYADKPRLYVDPADFDAQPDNAYRIVGDGAIEGRFGGATHRLDRRPEEPTCVYQAPGFRVTLDATTFAALDVAVIGPLDPGPRSLVPAATLAAILDGILGTAPHLPTAEAPAGSPIRHGTRVTEPALPAG